jgi:hypothetical protein
VIKPGVDGGGVDTWEEGRWSVGPGWRGGGRVGPRPGGLAWAILVLRTSPRDTPAFLQANVFYNLLFFYLNVCSVLSLSVSVSLSLFPVSVSLPVFLFSTLYFYAYVVFLISCPHFLPNINVAFSTLAHFLFVPCSFYLSLSLFSTSLSLFSPF